MRNSSDSGDEHQEEEDAQMIHQDEPPVILSPTAAANPNTEMIQQDEENSTNSVAAEVETLPVEQQPRPEREFGDRQINSNILHVSDGPFSLYRGIEIPPLGTILAQTEPTPQFFSGGNRRDNSEISQPPSGIQRMNSDNTFGQQIATAPSPANANINPRPFPTRQQPNSRFPQINNFDDALEDLKGQVCQAVSRE